MTKENNDIVCFQDPSTLLCHSYGILQVEVY